jgi:transcriptional regulator with XRE-family HTH domain
MITAGEKSMALDKASTGSLGWIERYVAIVAENVRRKRGTMTQQELADKAGVSRTVVQRVEAGKSVEFESLLKIAKALKVEPADLCLTEEDRDEFNSKTKRLVDALYRALEEREKK